MTIQSNPSLSGSTTEQAGRAGEATNGKADAIASRQTLRAIEATRNELHNLLDDLSTLARSGQGDLRSELERRVGQARDQFNTSIMDSRDVASRAREQIVRRVEASREVLSHRPLSSVTMAAIGGMVIGLLLGRRS
jgi:ElaB/YqjD/DUF883 family membrane-anchored ribosome-binding protein